MRLDHMPTRLDRAKAKAKAKAKVDPHAHPVAERRVGINAGWG